MNKKCIIAMSGGVDSSVAAFLMKEKGYECIGATMKLYDNEEIGISREKTCCSLDDIEDARAVARRLSMPYYVFNFKDEFEEKVINKFIRTYENGGTPNPCIDCNRYFRRSYYSSSANDCIAVIKHHSLSFGYCSLRLIKNKLQFVAVQISCCSLLFHIITHTGFTLKFIG